jgi:hypothetical protein
MEPILPLKIITQLRALGTLGDAEMKQAGYPKVVRILSASKGLR